MYSYYEGVLISKWFRDEDWDFVLVFVCAEKWGAKIGWVRKGAKKFLNRMSSFDLRCFLVSMVGRQGCLAERPHGLQRRLASGALHQPTPHRPPQSCGASRRRPCTYTSCFVINELAGTRLYFICKTGEYILQLIKP